MEEGAREETGWSRGDQTEGGARRDLVQEEPGRTQATAIIVAHGGADGGRICGGVRADDSRGPTDDGGASGGGAWGEDGEPMSQGNTEDPEGQGGAGVPTEATEAQAAVRVVCQVGEKHKVFGVVLERAVSLLLQEDEDGRVIHDKQNKNKKLNCGGKLRFTL